MQSFYKIQHREPSNKILTHRLKVIYPAIMLVLSIIIDYSRVLDFSVVPLICVLSLILFSLFLPSRQLIIWAFIYILVVTLALWIQRDKWATPNNNADALVATRVIVASGAGVIACLYAKLRERDDVTYLSVIQLLEQFSLPAIMSDSDGWLTHMNSEALIIFGEKTTPEAPFYEYFSDSSNKGKAIQNYMELASGMSQGPQRIDLSLMLEDDSLYSATMMRITIGTRNLVLTLFDLPVKPTLNKL